MTEYDNSIIFEKVIKSIRYVCKTSHTNLITAHLDLEKAKRQYRNILGIKFLFFLSFLSPLGSCFFFVLSLLSQHLLPMDSENKSCCVFLALLTGCYFCVLERWAKHFPFKTEVSNLLDISLRPLKSVLHP